MQNVYTDIQLIESADGAGRVVITPITLEEKARLKREKKLAYLRILTQRNRKYRTALAKLELLIASRVAIGEKPFRTKGEALLYIGYFSKPSKMPCKAWSISAKKCKRGSKLARIPGSICKGCYALGNFYSMPDTMSAMERRFARLTAYLEGKAPYFIDAFVKALEDEKYFRWFDSGDIQSLAHLEAMAEIARRSPQCKFWLPTKEYKGETQFVLDFVAKHGVESIPANLTIRLSAYFVNEASPFDIASRIGVVTSTAHTDGEYTCPASRQKNFCLDCRNCWDQSIPNIGYKWHGKKTAVLFWKGEKIARN